MLLFLAVASAAPAPEPGTFLAPSLPYKVPIAYGALHYPGVAAAPLNYAAPGVAYNYPAYNYNYLAPSIYGKIY